MPLNYPHDTGAQGLFTHLLFLLVCKSTYQALLLIQKHCQMLPETRAIKQNCRDLTRWEVTACLPLFLCAFISTSRHSSSSLCLSLLPHSSYSSPMASPPSSSLVFPLYAFLSSHFSSLLPCLDFLFQFRLCVHPFMPPFSSLPPSCYNFLLFSSCLNILLLFSNLSMFTSSSSSSSSSLLTISSSPLLSHILNSAHFSIDGNVRWFEWSLLCPIFFMDTERVTKLTQAFDL